MVKVTPKLCLSHPRHPAPHPAPSCSPSAFRKHLLGARPPAGPGGFHVHTRSETTEGHVGVGSAAGLSGEFLGIQQGGWAASFSSTLSRLFHSVLKDRGRLPVGPSVGLSVRRPGLPWMPPGPGSLPTQPAHVTQRRREGSPHSQGHTATKRGGLPRAHPPERSPASSRPGCPSGTVNPRQACPPLPRYHQPPPPPP